MNSDDRGEKPGTDLQEPSAIKLKTAESERARQEIATAKPPIEQTLVVQGSTSALVTLSTRTADVQAEAAMPEMLEATNDASTGAKTENPTLPPLTDGVWLTKLFFICIITMGFLNLLTPLAPDLIKHIGVLILIVLMIASMGWSIYYTTKIHQYIQLLYKDARVYRPRQMTILGTLTASILAACALLPVFFFWVISVPDTVVGIFEALMYSLVVLAALLVNVVGPILLFPQSPFSAGFLLPLAICFLISLPCLVLAGNNVKWSRQLGRFLSSKEPVNFRSAISPSLWVPFYAFISWPLLFVVGPLAPLLFMWSIKKKLKDISGETQFEKMAATMFAKDPASHRPPYEVSDIRHSSKVMAAKDQESERVIIRYRAFATIERWIKLRYAGHSLRKTHDIKPFLGAVTGFAIWFLGLSFLIKNKFFDTVGSLIASTFQGTHYHSSLVAASIGQTNLLVLQSFVILGLGATVLLIIHYLKQPTQVEIDSKGIRLVRRRGPYWALDLPESMTSTFMAWSDMVHVELSKPSANAHPSQSILRFVSTDLKQLKLKLDAIESVEDKESILRSIEKWAPSLNRSADVIQMLQAPADHSYTELWLQALTTPPKREKLKPLVQGAIIKDGLYKVIRSIGVGGQGFAYLATNALTKQSVVLKEFLLPVFVDINVRKRALEKFENEAKILKQLDHPQIVKLLDFFVEDHRAYLVLEHIDGKSIREIVKRQGPLSEKRVQSLALLMCTILEYLHSQSPPVVHRDFTPDNLILRHDGTLKVIDFNVAQQIETTQTGSVVGKHAYLPPEQFRGMPIPQSDIYAMGATLYFMLTGTDPEPISESHPQSAGAAISERMDSLVAKATSQNLDDRFANVEALASELDYDVEEPH